MLPGRAPGRFSCLKSPCRTLRPSCEVTGLSTLVRARASDGSPKHSAMTVNCIGRFFIDFRSYRLQMTEKLRYCLLNPTMCDRVWGRDEVPQARYLRGVHPQK